jgi:hypothetical protein
MAKEGQGRPIGLDAIAGAVGQVAAKGAPPVHLWNPPFCGDLDLRIAADGTWYYLKTPIGRPALVKLFASVLKREGDNYFLVTPVEKCGITVDEAPFLAVYQQVHPVTGERIGRADAIRRLVRLGLGVSVKAKGSAKPSQSASGPIRVHLHHPGIPRGPWRQSEPETASGEARRLSVARLDLRGRRSIIPTSSQSAPPKTNLRSSPAP